MSEAFPLSCMYICMNIVYFLAWREQRAPWDSPFSLGQVHTPTLVTHLDKLSDKQLCGIMLVVGWVGIVAGWLSSYLRLAYSVSPLIVGSFLKICMYLYTTIHMDHVSQQRAFNNKDILMACSQCNVNLSQLIALLGAHLCLYPSSVSEARVICRLPLPQPIPLSLCILSCRILLEQRNCLIR